MGGVSVGTPLRVGGPPRWGKGRGGIWPAAGGRPPGGWRGGTGEKGRRLLGTLRDTRTTRVGCSASVSSPSTVAMVTGAAAAAAAPPPPSAGVSPMGSVRHTDNKGGFGLVGGLGGEGEGNSRRGVGRTMGKGSRGGGGGSSGGANKDASPRRRAKQHYSWGERRPTSPRPQPAARRPGLDSPPDA